MWQIREDVSFPSVTEYTKPNDHSSSSVMWQALTQLIEIEQFFSFEENDLFQMISLAIFELLSSKDYGT